LQRNLEAALDRIMDAEDGALMLLDQNDELFQRIKNQLALIAKLQGDLARAKKWGRIGTISGFALGVIAGGVATYFLVN
jgi:hypothetical protein